MRHCHKPRKGWRQVIAGLAATGGILWLAQPAAAQGGGASAATYEVTFQGNWTTASTPGGVVSGAHFTTLVGAVHNDSVTFWRSGGPASPGVENVAELGVTGRFESEVNAFPHAAALIKQSIARGGTASATFTIDVTPDHPLVTLLSMIGPSPDWFVGISGRSLLDGSGQWLERDEVDLFPYDAGTEEGDEFSLSNPATQPQGAITSIRGTGKFSNERMARLTFVLAATEARPTVSLSASPNPVDEGSPVTVSATLSQALATDVTIPLTLTPGTAEPGDHGDPTSITIDGDATTGSVEVTTTDDADADDETFTVALGDLPASLAKGAPSSVEVTISDDDPAPPARPGPPAVISGDGTLEVSWPAVAGAESYMVQWRSGAEEYSDARQKTVQAPSATLSGLINGVAYTVRVRASNAGGDSDWSDEATETPLQPVPALPAAGAGLLGLLLAWLGGRQRAPARRP